MSKHTPGPWEYDYRVSIKAGTRLIALVYSTECDGDGETNLVNNGDLIAAAPDLLEALRTADRTFAENGLLACHASRQEISAAIAKATGAQA